ncbi:hypothetical protein BKH46_07340 [Helicobacter sp. 12S02634-8]|uniref:CvpA family protein n=1 Tax=Helicobacter sp. 12S02634-8 TaxID=1476199 RepID=UPI000BA70FF4|nr:CvpA family protein [Helicobacter sp. 12S02634-8]PAF46549.1 hypothetical protein BKH46_07340 [Helicobacter sp. 12S02634-8]
MGYIDILLIVIICIIGLRGFYNGFISEVAGVLGVVVGVFLASRFAGLMGEWLNVNIHNFNSPSIGSLIGFVIILAVIWVAFLIFGILIGKLIKVSDFVIVDKALGFIFSCCKVFLILGFILYAITQLQFMKSFANYMEQNSRVYSIMDTISATIMKLQSVQDTGNAINNLTQKPAQSVQNALNGIKDTTQGLTDPIKSGLERITTSPKETPQQEQAQ